jgi:predicted amidohydrolase
MQDLRVTLVQTDIHWEKPGANRAALEEKLWSLSGNTDLIVLPEMFTTGFTMNVLPNAEPMNLHTFKWMKQMAEHTHAVVLGSYIVQEKGNYYNRLLWMEPNGKYATYDKRHLFRMAQEHQTFSPGNALLIREWKGWKICPLVCYDLRFPVWSRNVDLKYDLLVYVANWPEVRNHPWKILLQARAIENLSYLVGVNRVGKDGNDMPYSGDSAVVSYKGEVLWTESNQECVHTFALSWLELQSFREKFPAHQDADAFDIKVTSF